MPDVKTISERSKNLIDVAMGRKPADIVIRNGKWVCVQSGEIISKTDIAISEDRIAYVGPDATHTTGDQTKIIDAEDQYLVPGLLDAHMHVESGMVTVTEFVRAVIPHGTTGMFIDPHEIANVFGLRGVRLMVDEASDQPIHVFVQVPSCVPSAPGFETPGGSIGPEEVGEAIQWDGIVGLGEMMNFPGVIESDQNMLFEIAETHLSRKVIGGHYASPDLGIAFHGYAAGGIEDDHEGTRLEDALIRVRQGMKVMMRFGSAWHDVESQVRAVTEIGLDPRHFLLCTDDSHSQTLVEDGHMDRVVRHAINTGLKPVTAIQMATLNTAEHFGLSKDIGMIAPGRFADILIVESLEDFHAKIVLSKGKIVAQDGELLLDKPRFEYPAWVKNSILIGRNLTAENFRLHAPSRTGSFRANIIGVIENQAPTRHLQMVIDAIDGEIQSDIERDIIKVALVERHQGTGNIQIGLVHGFGFKAGCAVGSTVVHDSHHMIIVGTDDAQMAIAANHLAQVGGGQLVVKNNEVIGAVELPIAGLMSDQRAEIVSKKAASVLRGFKDCGCMLNSPNMQLSLLGLVVIPELRISDLGLVDVTSFTFLPVLEKNL